MGGDHDYDEHKSQIEKELGRPISKEEYFQIANDFVNDAYKNPDIIVGARSLDRKGAVVIYNSKTNEIAFVSINNEITSYYIVNARNPNNYFYKQIDWILKGINK